MSTRSIASVLAVVALASGLAGCVVHEGEADVTFLWDFAGQGCAEAGARYVDVWVEDLGDGSVDEFVGIPCTDGGIRFDIEPGLYYVEFWSDNDWFAAAEVRLRSGDNELFVHLTP